MRVGILFNPGAGRGRGEAAAGTIDAALRSGGFTTKRLSTRDGSEALAAFVGGLDRLVIAGGDGTLHHALPVLVASRVPVYHAALGTENLFAREFGHSTIPSKVLAAMRGGGACDIDVGLIAPVEQNGASPRGAMFAIVASVGPDASVVHRLSATRRGPIRHWSYARPILDELLDPVLPEVTVRVDGREIACRERGGLIIANMRQYALRIDPLTRADARDGMLDAMFIPATDLASYAAGLVAMRLRMAAGSWGGRVARGAIVHIELHGTEGRFQADGEVVSEQSIGLCKVFERHVFLKVQSSALRVCCS